MKKSRPWHTNKPPINHVVEIWLLTSVILAVWTGVGWQTVDGDWIAENTITHWRER